jgi:RNA polymerase sigma-32 factor
MASQGFDSYFSRYKRDMERFPILAAEEEYRLVTSWREQGNANALHRLVTSHLRLIANIAIGYRGYGLPLADIISAGNLGMVQAVHGFKLDHGARLATYASWWIRAAIQDYVLNTWSLVKIGTTGPQKKLFFNLRRLKAQLGTVDQGELSPELASQIATSLDVPESDVVSMNRRLSGPDFSLNVPFRSDEDDEWQAWLSDDRDNQEVALGDNEEQDRRHKILSQAMEKLDERERNIVISRHLRDKPVKRHQLGAEYGISSERVRQIEVGAIEKLRRAAASYGKRYGTPDRVDATRTTGGAARK